MEKLKLIKIINGTAESFSYPSNQDIMDKVNEIIGWINKKEEVKEYAEKTIQKINDYEDVFYSRTAVDTINEVENARDDAIKQQARKEVVEEIKKWCENNLVLTNDKFLDFINSLTQK